MATTSIGSDLITGTYTLLRASVEEKQLRQKAETLDTESNKTSASTGLKSEIAALLDNIPKGDDNRLSFTDVENYRKEMGDKWDREVMADLKALGVDVSKEFAMTYDPDTGKVTVPDKTKDAEIINKYFEDNPDKVAEFYDIIQLGKLNATASSQLSQSQMLTSLRQQSLAWWYADNTDPTSWFEGGGLLAIGGNATSYTGLNMMV
ncbi:hypothetical protein [Pseudodesulfovibrio indicus]|uniref:Uncharacterized protein n=1 Tax=Pseudodesulfovibrio indicus TaxID=1716143 RepID=A0A126QSW4_9BACT|nr:hypothetical protein [Pseudodesulfovibrio indicus]AMK12836.1 hypothetical protein AWY79_17865 [Pseudodesulfovibrio indicus]TDT82061.1 hypothetical protein EDC59_11740 [Pseudodesulfovibrio indicus]